MSDSQPSQEMPKRVNPKPMVSQRPPSERIAGSQGEPTRLHQTPPTQATKRPPAPPSAQTESGLVVPWWGFVLVILAVAGITCGLWGLVLLNRNNTTVAGIGPTPTPIIFVITATPTLGLAPETVTETPPAITVTSSEATPTEFIIGPTQTVPLIPIEVGSIVQVVGTEGLGVKIRQGPGTTYGSLILAADGDVFRVEGGPEEADGYVWWQVIDPQDPSRAGWVVQDFIEAID